MSETKVPVIVGDTVTLTVKGRVVETGTPGAATVRISRPGNVVSKVPPMRVDLLLDRDTEITHTIESRFKNGVHIDGNGAYWMRKPDGWYKMRADYVPAADPPGAVFVPKEAQRLKEDPLS
jgi:hypothetical protein